MRIFIGVSSPPDEFTRLGNPPILLAAIVPLWCSMPLERQFPVRREIFPISAAKLVKILFLIKDLLIYSRDTVIGNCFCSNRELFSSNRDFILHGREISNAIASPSSARSHSSKECIDKERRNYGSQAGRCDRERPTMSLVARSTSSGTVSVLLSPGNGLRDNGLIIVKYSSRFRHTRCPKLIRDVLLY